MKNIVFILASLIAAIALPVAWPLLFPPSAMPDSATPPWSISLDEMGRNTVFGLTPGRSTLADARRVFSSHSAIAPELALIGQRNELPALEAFFDSVRLGPLTGRIIVTLLAPDAERLAMRARAIKSDHMDSAVIRSTLTANDAAHAEQMPITAIVFVPSARLDDTIIHNRFGAPSEKIADSSGLVHYLYPTQGLDIALSSRGKAQLQYVQPADFARLRAPLTTPQQAKP
jgi:hypothetical protein